MTQDEPLPPDLPVPDRVQPNDTDKTKREAPLHSHNPARLPPQRPVGFTLTSDTPCRRCDYNLRGLDSTGLCPECGAPVSFSLRRYMLRYGYLRDLASGAHILVWGESLTIAASLSCLGCLANGGALLHCICAIIVLFGLWLLTTADPSGTNYPRNRLAPRLARSAQSIGFVLACVAGLASVQAPRWTGSAVLASMVACGVARIAMLFQVGRLGNCIPDYAIAIACPRIRILLAVVSSLTFAMLLISIASPSVVDMVLSSWLLFAMGSLYLSSEIWLVTILWRLTTLLRPGCIRNPVAMPNR